MGLRVAQVPRAKTWRLLLETYTEGKKRTSHIKQDDWPAGFTKNLNLADAKELASRYNQKNTLIQQEIRRQKIAKRLNRENRITSVYLPKRIVEDFENRMLPNKFGKEALQKKFVFWRAGKKLIKEISIDPSDWFLQPEPIYRYFVHHAWSMDYCLRILKFLNFYGHVYCRRDGTPWSPVDPPGGEWRRKIEDAFFDKNPAGFKSDLITKKDLAELKQKMLAQHYHWTFISFWFGLRPEETELLKTKPGVGSRWWIRESDKGKSLVLYQPKLRCVRRKDRYKFIPILYPEQEEALDIVRSKEFRRPSLQVAKKHFPEGATLYAPRHGFASTMEKLGHDLRVVSRWLGHQRLETTERYYRDRQIVHFPQLVPYQEAR